MPRRQDIQKICVIGAGPIVIGQACEFDYSGTQALKALKAEGFEIVLVNSNPATIMTDPEMADVTYVEPLVPEVLTRILEQERPDAVLPTLGGQTALNLALALHEEGVLDRLGIELLGAGPRAIQLAEDRELFKALMLDNDLDVARSGTARSIDEGRAILSKTGLPVILRPFFTLGGVGGSVAYTVDEFDKHLSWALAASPVGMVLIEESLLGWREFEMEVVRDSEDRGIIICSIENFDPMGVHTGDSITVAPAQTLTDREYQAMRDASLKIIRLVGVATGGSNIQFAIDPRGERMVVIEMNPRVSRSSALASKATGFPIAKIAALLAVGFTLDELPNDITRNTSACFEPTLDYVVTKIPRFAFEKFPGAERGLTTQMKSIGEVMAIGRTFGESMLKALRGLEAGTGSLAPTAEISALSNDGLIEAMRVPTDQRLLQVAEGLRRGLGLDAVRQATHIDAWFLAELIELIEEERDMEGRRDASLTALTLGQIKRLGFSDKRIGQLRGVDEATIRSMRREDNVVPVYKRVDTCAAEFEAFTPYLYSTFEDEDESDVDHEVPSVIILGSGPNRIGQGIEFDYCCVKAAKAIRAAGLKAVMVNCNPETVSTDHDISDRLYFEPIDLEAVLEIVRVESPKGVIVQLGGQTPLRLAEQLAAEGVTVLGTSADTLDRAEDRARFGAFAQQLELNVPEHRTVSTPAAAHEAADVVGFPVVVRPSNVLGGRSMEIIYDHDQLDVYLKRFFIDDTPRDERALPLLIDHFLVGAVEVDVDALCDGTRAIIGGVMEQVEHTGVHSGDSACFLPSATLSPAVEQALRDLTRKIALSLGVVGLINVQYAVCGDQPEDIFVIEVNPRASRTVPFVSKVTGTCMATAATHLMLGSSLDDLGMHEDLVPQGHFCKEVVLPLSRFGTVSPKLSPEMRSTGEVMAQGATPSAAFARAQLAASNAPTREGGVFIDTDEASVASLNILRGALGATPLFAPPEQVEVISQALDYPVTALDVAEDDTASLAFALFLRPPGVGLEDQALSLRFRHILRARCAYFTSVEAAHHWLVGVSQMDWKPVSLQALHADA